MVESLALLDGDVLRRAAISRSLLAQRIHVEPFENISELVAHWPRSGLLLVHDEGDRIPALIEHMAEWHRGCRSSPMPIGLGPSAS